MPISYSASSSDSIEQMNSKAPALASPMSVGLFTATAEKPGQRAHWAKAPHFSSVSL